LENAIEGIFQQCERTIHFSGHVTLAWGVSPEHQLRKGSACHQNPINVGQIDGFSLAKVEHEVGWQLACSLLE
jgi:hypothetical protein